MRANSKIPKDELFLAKIIQNAAAKGLRACRGEFFKSDLHKRCGKKHPRIAFCCAMGAAQLSEDTEKQKVSPAVTEGNDGVAFKTLPYVTLKNGSVSLHPWQDAFEIGQAFFDTLSPLDKCSNCDANEPAQETLSGASLKNPGWSRHAKGLIACGPYCAGQLTVRESLSAHAWITPRKGKQP